MKKILYMMLFSLILLAACNAEEPNNNQSTNEPIKETEEKPNESEGLLTEQQTEDNKEKLIELSQESQPRETPQPLTEVLVKEIIDYYGIGEGDKLTNVSFVNREIKATIDLAPNEKFPAKDMAVNRYSQLSDELLKHEGWEILSITYPNIGTISMNRNEKETNEFGDYFPTMVIEERLKR
ncbi:hypothetical protein ACIQAA_25140 [Neobacillus sp. NPDC093182]|uniref:hypothetical protein n=1 Tax=Neobacillus sp. NPDC093182 TaxID=3364297 RepID=UPI0037FB7721